MARLIIMILIPFTAILVKYSVIKVRKCGVFLHLYFKSLFKEQKVLSTISSFISYLAETNDRILLLDREWYLVFSLAKVHKYLHVRKDTKFAHEIRN